MKVCAAHQKRVVERWGWGAAPGQEGGTTLFPMVGIYCQQHGKNRFDMPKPSLRTVSRYDGSSIAPIEWLPLSERIVETNPTR